jgi:diguanylate cyclase (GGDEF)-like protein
MGFSVSELFQTTFPKLFTLLIGMWLGFFGLASLFIFFFIHALTRPIRDLELGVKMLTSGNFDYPVNVTSRDELGKLGASFDHMRQSLRDTFAKLQSLSSMDEITHIYSQNIFHNLLDQEIARARRYKYPMALILVRLENYELLAKALAPDVLKTTLVKVTSLLQNCIRNTDNMARYQTQTFALILPQSDHKSSQIIVDRIRNTVGSITPLDAKAQPLPLRLQIGVATLESHKTTVSKAEFIAQAESRLNPDPPQA